MGAIAIGDFNFTPNKEGIVEKGFRLQNAVNKLVDPSTFKELIWFPKGVVLIGKEALQTTFKTAKYAKELGMGLAVTSGFNALFSSFAAITSALKLPKVMGDTFEPYERIGKNGERIKFAPIRFLPFLETKVWLRIKKGDNYGDNKLTPFAKIAAAVATVLSGTQWAVSSGIDVFEGAGRVIAPATKALLAGVAKYVAIAAAAFFAFSVFETGYRLWTFDEVRKKVAADCKKKIIDELCKAYQIEARKQGCAFDEDSFKEKMYHEMDREGSELNRELKERIARAECRERRKLYFKVIDSASKGAVIAAGVFATTLSLTCPVYLIGSLMAAHGLATFAHKAVDGWNEDLKVKAKQ